MVKKGKLQHKEELYTVQTNPTKLDEISKKPAAQSRSEIQASRWVSNIKYPSDGSSHHFVRQSGNVKQYQNRSNNLPLTSD